MLTATAVGACLCALLVVQPPEPAAPRPTRVELGLAAEDELLNDQDVELTLAAHLADAELHAHVDALGPGDLLDRIAWAEANVDADVLAVFFTERVDDGGRRLYLLEPQSGGLWVRELPRTADDDLLLETLGAMVRGISTALHEGPPRGMTEVARPDQIQPDSDSDSEPVAPVQPAPDPEPVAPPPRTLVTVTGAYLGSMFARTHPWQSGGALGVNVELPAHAVLGIRVGVFAPARVGGPPDLDMWRIPVRLHGAYRFLTRSDVRPEIGLGMVVGTLTWRGAKAQAGSNAQPGQAVRIALSPQAGIQWRVVGGLGVHLNTMLDVWLSNADLVVEDGSARRSQLRPYAVTVALEAGLQYTF
ncbi:MAG: hypothetical protein ACRBN8_32915 [Nannocystales bacterium]